MEELPKGWALTCLDSLADYVNGFAFKPNDWMDEGKPIIRIQNLTDPSKAFNRTLRKVDDKYEVQTGDILVSWSATLDVYLWDRGPSVLNQHIFKVIPRHDIVTKKFLFYLLKEEIQRLVQSEHLHGSTMRHINRGPFLAHRVELPPLAEQHRIVEKLDRLMARSRRAREEIKRIPKLVERYKQAVLEAAFSGELTADWRKDSDRYVSVRDHLRIAEIPVLENGTLKQLPKSWAWVAIGDMCQIKGGITLGKKRAPGTELVHLPYLRVANVQRGFLVLDEVKTIAVTSREAEALYLQPGDILMNEGGDRDKLGRGWVWEGQIDRCIHQNHVFRLRLKMKSVPPRYVSYYANEFGQFYFMDQGKQTTNLASISLSKLSRMPIPIAQPEEMELIVERIEELFAHIDATAQESRRAADLLDRLDRQTLAKAFRGELVPQDPNDEPASVLLKRIQNARNEEINGRQKGRARRENSRSLFE